MSQGGSSLRGGDSASGGGSARKRLRRALLLADILARDDITRGTSDRKRDQGLRDIQEEGLTDLFGSCAGETHRFASAVHNVAERHVGERGTAMVSGRGPDSLASHLGRALTNEERSIRHRVLVKLGYFGESHAEAFDRFAAQACKWTEGGIEGSEMAAGRARE